MRQGVFEVYGVFLPGGGAGLYYVVSQGGEKLIVHLVLFAERFFLFGVFFEVVEFERVEGGVLEELEVTIACGVVGLSAVVASFPADPEEESVFGRL